MSGWWQSNLAKYGRVALGIFVVALLFLLANQNSTAAVGLNKGDMAPDFTLTDLDGNQVSLSDFRGKTVFLNFWATWCPPCRAEMPEMAAVYQEYTDKEVVIIGIDIQEPAETVRQFVQDQGYSWTFLLDTSGMVTADYEIVAIPTSFFLDKEGIIRAVNVNAMTKREIEAKLAEAMR
ncbi:MAG: TlpA disulfide reductase family protein [Dehalococcoidales bacterium]